MTLDQILAAARRRLSAAGIHTAGLDARMLVGAALGVDAARLVVDGDKPVDAAAAARVEALVGRRIGGEPVGRILGRRGFHGLDLLLGPDTLEPRPDTETLVDVAVDLVRRGRVPGAAHDGTGLLFADVGTGSGAIALAVLAMLPGARAIATDISPGALAVAGRNAEAAGLSARISFRHGDYLEPVTEVCGLILSNPPYIESGDIAGLAPEVRLHDPMLALDGGPDGLVAYRALSAGVAGRLAAGGTIAVEIGSLQAPAVSGLLRDAGLRDVRVTPDLAGLDRVVTATAPPDWVTRR